MFGLEDRASATMISQPPVLDLTIRGAIEHHFAATAALEVRACITFPAALLVKVDL